jgi:hypothetical protein
MRSSRTFAVCILLLSTFAVAQAPTIPTIEQPLTPAAVPPGGPAFTLTINGAGFTPQPIGVLFGGTQLAITSSSATQLTVNVPAANIATAGTASVSVLRSNIIASNAGFFQIATSASPLFAPPVDYNVAAVTMGPALVADFNRDGILDLAVCLTSNSGPQVAVLLGVGDGTFQNPVLYNVDDSSSIVAGIFTLDGGSIDLVAGNTLLVGQGNGTFTPTPLIPGFAGFHPFAVADFTNTGTLDIAGLVGNNVQIVNGDGGGGFTLGQNFNGNISQAGGLLAADFDGDGFLDLAVLDNNPNAPVVWTFLGSSGGFSGGNGIATATPAGGVAFTAADFNGDNHQDLAFVYNPAAGGAVTLILKGNGDGTFTAGFSQVLTNPVTGSVVTGDFNEDGILDLATGTSILQGIGDGTFQAPIDFGGTSQVMATGDFDNDGRPDLAANASPNVAILLQQVPVATLSPPSLTFNPQMIGTTSGSQPVTLTNTGNAVLTIKSIGIIGTNAGDFGQTNTCGASLAAAASCTINVTFTPTVAGDATAAVAVADNALGSPQLVALDGVGLTGPAVTLNPSPVTFGSPEEPQVAGTSASTKVSLTNSGDSTLTLSTISITGTDASEFTQTNDCPTQLAPDTSCTVTVTFTPTVGGNATASLSVSDNAAGSPQTAPLTGTSQSVLTTTCTSLTVVRGQTAVFTVDLAPVDGFAPSVTLSCSGAPAPYTCTVSPSSVSLDGSSPVQAQVTVTTSNPPAMGLLHPPLERSNGNRMAGLVGLAGIAGFAALVVLPGKRRGKPGRRLFGSIFCLCILATLVILPSCGGGSGGPAAGTYPLTVTGSFQSSTGAAATEQVSFNLVVR